VSHLDHTTGISVCLPNGRRSLSNEHFLKRLENAEWTIQMLVLKAAERLNVIDDLSAPKNAS